MTYEEAFHKIEESGLEIMITENDHTGSVLLSFSDFVIIMHEVSDDIACEITNYKNRFYYWPWINDVSEPLNNELNPSQLSNKTSVLRFHVMLRCIKRMC